MSVYSVVLSSGGLPVEGLWVKLLVIKSHVLPWQSCLIKESEIQIQTPVGLKTDSPPATVLHYHIQVLYWVLNFNS